MLKELPVPPDAFEHDDSREFLRGWIINKLMYCSVNVGVYGDKEMLFWGTFLSDAAHHIADALHKDKGLDKDKTIAAIKKAFNEKLKDSHDEFEGDFV